MLPVAALAQSSTDDTSGRLEEIIVTANKRAQNLTDVPISIAAYTSVDIEKSAIREVEDYALLTPNVGFDTDGSPSDSTIFIRGVGNLGGNTASVITYIDEVAVTPSVATGLSGNGLDANDPNLSDIERIEVLRGPQGVSFGRSALGGAVSITTAKPGPEVEGRIDAEYGRFGTGLVRGMANVPVSDSVFLRANAYYTFSDGYLRNFGSSGDSNDYDGQGGSLALRLLPSDRLTFDFRAAAREFRQGLDSGVPTGVLSPTLIALGFDPVDDGQGFYPENRRAVATDAPTETDIDSTNLSARVAYDFGASTAILVLGYLDGQVDYAGDGDLSASDFTFDDNDVEYSATSAELRLQSDDESGFGYVAGVNYNRDKSSSAFVRTFGTAFFGGFFEGDRPIDEVVRATVTNYAAFVDLRWTFLDDALTVSLGGRYSDSKFEGSYDEVVFLFVPGQYDPFTASRSNSSSAFTPRLNVVYAVTSDVNVYGTVSQGFKPAGASLLRLATDPATGQPFDANYGKETMWNYEVGIKGEAFDRRLRFGLAAFLMKWSDIQVGVGFAEPVDLDGDGIADVFDVTGATQNAASARSLGVELDLAARPTDALTVALAVGYNDTEFESFPNALVEDPATGATSAIDASGNQLVLAPEWSASASVEFAPRLGTRWQPFIRAEYVYKDEQFTDVSNLRAVNYVIPSYDYINAQIGFEFDRFRVTAYADNVTDENYITGFNGSQFFSGARAAVNPRTYGLRFSARFGED